VEDERRPGRRTALALAVLVAVAGLGVTLLGGVLAARKLSSWQETRRIQAGPRVLATIIATRPPVGRRQQVTLRYRDDAGGRHRLEVAFPLGIAQDVIPGMATSVVYDPRSPSHAELPGHPRNRWQDALLVAALTLGLTGVWLRTTRALLRRAGEEGTLRRAHVWGSLGVAATLAVVGGRIGTAILRAHPVQEVGFPPLPPKPILHAGRVALPPALTAPPPPGGPLVTTSSAQEVARVLWPLRDRALVRRDVTTLHAIERGPALRVDLARLVSGGAPNRSRAGLGLPGEFRVYVPRQETWPARFLLEAVTTSAGEPWLELMVVARRGARSSWQVVLDTGVGGTPAWRPHVDAPYDDGTGYDAVPRFRWLTSAAVPPELARYWQAWADTGRPPVRGPPFAPGTWTDRFGLKIAASQGRRDVNGLSAERRYGEPRPPVGELWTFGVYAGWQLVCSPVLETETWSGPTSQDTARQKWGWDLAPGRYRGVTSLVEREPCVYVPPNPVGKLVVIGADPWVVATRGDPA
jgi:hypothetical protein